MTTRRRFLSLATAAAVPHRGRAADQQPAPEAALDALVEACLKRLGLPGAQLAVGRERRILLSKAYGLADRERRLPVLPRTLFRIASISKPLTSAAVLTLVEAEKLTLETPMGEVLRIEPFVPEGKRADPRLKDITIRHLLQHTGGWDRDASGDAMFQNRRIAKALGVACPPGPREVIREVLGRPLDFAPGQRCVYSNFGYCVLGRVIENLGGGSYAGYVKEKVLEPAGIRGPTLGATLTQAEGEARYYAVDKAGAPLLAESVFPQLPARVPAPYGSWCLEQMDSHGGWIACAEDIVRFALGLDDIGGTSPFKRRETFDAMLAPAPGPPGHGKDGKPLEKSYGCGLRVLRGKAGIGFSHTGSLSGTSTLLMRRADGWCWALFFNRRLPDTATRNKLTSDIEKVFDAC